jgi:type IV secretion system protein VirD4
MLHEHDQQVVLLFIGALVVLAVLARNRWKPSATAFGTACWAGEQALKAAGMLGTAGLILGRTFSGKLIRLAEYTHVLLVGATGAGKGVAVIIPNLLAYYRGSVVCFDMKGDLTATCGRRRAAKGDRIIRLAPFAGKADCWNPLDMIAADSPTLIDSARAMAEALVVRQGTENDPHWNDKAAQIITALLVLVLMRFKDEDRNLSSVQEIASDTAMLACAADKLIETGGIPARMGQQIKTLFENEHIGLLSKEGAGVLSTVARHLSFLDSELVAQSVASSSFDAVSLLKPGTTLFLQIPPDQLEAQKGLLRCWISTLARMIGTLGDERTSEVLFLLDEASALGSLSAVEEALVRGRSAGVRMLLAYQSDSQVQAAFKDKPTLLYDNCTTQIYLGASSIETAERISKSLGEWTQTLEGYAENTGRSHSAGGPGNQSTTINRGSNFNWSVNARALLKPDEVLRLSGDLLIAFVRGMPPILARRIKWYNDAAFAASVVRDKAALWWGLAATGAALVLWGVVGGW